MEIRRAEGADLPLIGECNPSVAREAEREAYTARAVAAGSCYVAVERDRVRGYGIMDYTFFGNAFIELLYVRSEARRQGVGAALMVAMEGQAAGSKLFVSTNLSNLPMQRLLARLDYALSGVIHNLDEGDPELFYYKAVPLRATPAAG